jgi:predicted aldo/keto reductase-like oxidoreductase
MLEVVDTEIDQVQAMMDTVMAAGIAAIETVVVVGSIVAVVVVLATFAQVNKKVVVDTVVEMVRIAATEEMTPNWYFVVAVAAVDFADMGLVVAALLSPLQHSTIHFHFSVYM